jgi:hypothetical protein
MKTYSTILTLLLTMLITGCASTKIDKEALGRTKTAALIGFTVDERQPVSMAAIGKGMLGMEDGKGFGGGKISFEIQNASYVDAAYDIATKTLGDRLHIQFLTRDVVGANANLKTLFDKKHATFQAGVTPLKPYYDRFEAQNIPQSYYVQWADKQALNELAKSLGVDALVIVQSKTDLSAAIVGSMNSTAQVSIMFYDPTQSDFTTYLNQQGDSVSTKDVKFMGFADPNQMHIQTLEAMQTALTQAAQKL